MNTAIYGFFLELLWAITWHGEICEKGVCAVHKHEVLNFSNSYSVITGLVAKFGR